MRIDVKVAIVRSGRPQWQIAREVGIEPSRLSKYIGGYGHITPEEEGRLRTILELPGEEVSVTAQGEA
jgi:DNA transposition AAA+ family ATPase